jgi:hypothetical protein
VKALDANDILLDRGPDGLRTAVDRARGAARLNGSSAHDDRVAATPYRWINSCDIQPRQWLFDRHYVRKFLTATVSGSGVGKSSHALLDAISMASGRNLLTGAAMRPLRVWYWNGEDPHEELQRRIQAIALHYGLTEGDLADRLFIDSGRDQRIKVAVDDRHHGFVINRPALESMERTLRAHAIDVCTFDPFVSIHAVPENDNNAIDAVAKELAGVADRCDCAVETVHHVRKTNGAELTAEDARGAVALIGAARSVRVLNQMTAEEASRAGINPTERRLYFRVDNGKANMAPPSSTASWRQLIGVGLGNGTTTYPEDNVGVVTAWSWPDAFKGLTAADLKAVQGKVSAGAWRADVRSEDWVGRAVAEALELDLDDDNEKTRVKTLLKTWLGNGSLLTVERTDEGRKHRKFIEVGTWVDT